MQLDIENIHTLKYPSPGVKIRGLNFSETFPFLFFFPWRAFGCIFLKFIYPILQKLDFLHINEGLRNRPATVLSSFPQRGMSQLDSLHLELCREVQECQSLDPWRPLASIWRALVSGDQASNHPYLFQLAEPYNQLG